MNDSLGQFAIPGAVRISAGQGGLPLILVENRFAVAEIYLYGAHVVSFVPKGGQPLIWTSPQSPFEEGKAIRGGIPVCFPWFGPHRTIKEYPVHGFARFRSWELDSTAALSDGRHRVVLRLCSDEHTRSFWAYDFRALLSVTVGTSLEVEFAVENTGSQPFSYEDCLHTYFAVGDVRQTVLTGFDGVGYIDRVQKDSRAVQSGEAVLSGETVHVHTQAPAEAQLRDPVGKRSILATQKGCKETVSWNPGEAAAAKNPEMAGLWPQFFCLEAANCLDDRITLLPGTAHTSSVRYRAEAL